MTKQHIPYFEQFPINDNCTGWQRISLPIIVAVPYFERDFGQVLNLRIYIEGVPQQSIVAGPDHIGLKVPDRELFAQDVSVVDLISRQIPLAGTVIYRNGEIIADTDIQAGDTIQYTTASGIRSTFQYNPDTAYYDVSDITIETETLKPAKFNLVYEVTYHNRIVSVENADELLCIDSNNVVINNHKFLFNHPGDVLREMDTLTPQVYFADSSKSKDSTLALYRPFATILQDIHDEQNLLHRLNWVYDVQPEHIPYLSALLGWDIPYFPQSLDQLRRAVLRRTVEFQNLKGSRKALKQLFQLFGFEILISNLWWSSDGKKLIRPGEKQPPPYEAEQINIVDKTQTELVLDGFTTSGYGDLQVPLLFRPLELADSDIFVALQEGGNISIDAYLVETDSDADAKLAAISATIKDDPEAYGSCTTDSLGFINPTDIHTQLNNEELLGYSQVLISGKFGQATTEILTGSQPPLSKVGVQFDRSDNVLRITFNGYLDFTNAKLYAFASYHRQVLDVPAVLADLQSNRFDIHIITNNLSQLADPTTLEFALDFLSKIKAMHSLLNVVIQGVTLSEDYLVTDLAVGGDIQQRYDIDFGKLQVPPAILPLVPDEISSCTQLDPTSLGYKRSDIEYRLRKIKLLVEEFDAWKRLDDRTGPFDFESQLAALDSGRGACVYNPFGQDRVIGTKSEERIFETGPAPTAGNNSGTARLSAAKLANKGQFNESVSTPTDSSTYSSFTVDKTSDRTPQCTLDGSDYYFKGRVDDQLMYRQAAGITEKYINQPCAVGLGTGLYWTFPSISQTFKHGTRHTFRSHSLKPVYTGGATEAGESLENAALLGEYLSYDFTQHRSSKINSLLGRKLANYNAPQQESLHYSNRKSLGTTDIRKFIAFDKPSLDIQIPTSHFPGCRFPMQFALANDFTSSVWKLRPWDIQACAKDCTGNVIDLHPVLHQADGYEYLTFDDMPYTLTGNGYTPDIAFFDGASTGNTVHSIYLGQYDSPYVTLEGVSPFDSNVDKFISTDAPLFGSANQCGTEYTDFSDGYPSSGGNISVAVTDIFRSEIYSHLGLDIHPLSVDVSYLFNSGIKTGEKGLRYDCGCLLAGCGGTDTSDDCEYTLDWEPDHVELEQIMGLDESLGCGFHTYNAVIPSSLETV